MPLKRLIFFILITLPLVVLSQKVEITGFVKDESSKKALAFVNIIAEDGYGTTTDIDGKFTIRIPRKNKTIKLTYVGYETKIYQIDKSSKTHRIYLKPKLYLLDEVEVFPGVNPAHRIIDSVVRNRNKNNPNKLKAFSYTSYDKMIVTLDADSLMLKDTALLDSTERRARAFISKQDIFIMETVTERKFKSPGLNQETVLATKVSGFKDPMMTLMISQIQSTSFYDGLIRIAGKKYINPISTGSTRKYFFLIEDTTYTETKDTVFIISFRPMKKTKFDGMKGFLSINTNGWAIQNVKSQPSNDTTGIVVKIEQAYEIVDKHWFPVQLHTDVIFMNAQMAAGDQKYNLVGNGRSYIRDISLNPDLKKREFGFSEVEIEPDATRKVGEFWSEYRVDSLTDREKETYRVIDSLGKEENFDRMANIFQTLLSGKLPIKFIDIDLGKIVHYNNFEGLYLGLGISTNETLSNKVKAGIFWGYGFSDKRAKYGFDVDVLLHKRSDSRIRLDAYYNVIASGDVEFFDDKNRVWRPDYFYRFLISQMNYTLGVELNYSFRIRPLRDFKWNAGLRVQEKQAYRDYFFAPGGDTLNKQTIYNFTDLQIGFRFAYRERTIETTKGQISLGSDFPVVWLNYTRGIAGLLGGDYNYNKFDLKIEDKIYIKYFGEFSFRLMGGIVLGDIPISNNYNGKGTYRIFTIYAPFSFATMRANEFYSNRYASLFLSHNFGNLLFDFKKWHPELVLITNIGFGTFTTKDDHYNIDFNTMEHGYYESGLLIRKILDLRVYDLGIGALYRYGPYSFDNVSLNFAYKITLFYNF